MVLPRTLCITKSKCDMIFVCDFDIIAVFFFPPVASLWHCIPDFVRKIKQRIFLQKPFNLGVGIKIIINMKQVAL